MYSIEITYVHHGIEYRHTIEDVYPTAYARAVGAVEGITRGGAQVTFMSTMSDPYAIVNA